MFAWKQKIKYGIENWNDMRRINEKEVNKIAECYLLHDIINPPKRNKIVTFITLLFYIYVLILEEVKQSLVTSESY